MNTQMIKRAGFLFLTAILALCLTAWKPPPVKQAPAPEQPAGIALAVTITVTNLNDSGPGSLRQAIADAAPDDTITFDSSLSGGTIYLASTLTLSKNVTIDGSALASQITISGDTDNNGTGDVQVFFINAGVTATLNSLTITKGNSAPGDGGGIFNYGTLTVTNSTFSGNSAGSGSGIFNQGTLTVTNSTFSGNSASYYGGSGIFNYGALTVTNSTFSGNSAYYYGGGIFNGGTLTVTNSTFSGNSAPILGGGIFNTGTLNYANTIIANSTSGGDCANSGTIGTNTNNLVEDGSCSASLSGGPNLGALADNGGPTQTMALLAGSPAIDAGDDATCPTTDQRGVARPQGLHCDIGAFEYTDREMNVQGNGVDIWDGDTTPSEADHTDFGIANETGGSVDRTFTIQNSGNINLTLSGTPLVSISGATAADFSITSDPSTPVAPGGSTTFTVHFDPSGIGTLTASISIDNNDSDENPYNFDIQGTGCSAAITVTNTDDSGAGSLRQAIADLCAGGTIEFNPSLAGGTIHLASALTLSKNVTIDGSALASQITISGDTGNNGTGDVRVFYVNAGVTATLNSLTITKGYESIGGGIYNYYGTLTVTNSTFSGNSSSSGYGGGIFNYNGTLTVTNSTFSGNSSSGRGGGIANYNGTLTVTNSTLSGNSAGVYGGGIFNYNGTLAVTNSTFSGNSSNYSGGGIHNTGTLTVTNSTLSGNSASGYGGGIYTNGTLNYANTILANSTSGGDCVNSGTIGTNTNNLVEDGSCLASLSGDPNLGALADNGGTTQTHALLAGSPAIDAGASCSGAPVNGLDQRGYVRDASCDIGAYEYNASPPPHEMNVQGNGVDIWDGDTTPSEADHTDFGSADVTSGSVDRTFTIQNTGDADLTLSGTPLVSISGANAADFSITSDPSTPVAPGGSTTFTVHFDPSGIGTLTASISIDNNDSDENPYNFDIQGAALCSAAITVTNTDDSGAGSLRQAITDLCAGGTIEFNPSLAGGTIHLASTLTLSKNVTIDGSALASQITISGDTDDNGTGDVRVFAVSSGVTATLNSLTITKGYTSGDGGGVFNLGTLTVTNSAFSGNSASSNGGGIYSIGTLTVTNSTFSGNSAAGGDGGGIHNEGTLTVTNSTFSGNSAEYGGGIANWGTLTIANNIFSSNSAYLGGGIANWSMLTVTNSTFSDNSASEGGGIYSFFGALTVTNSTFSANSAGSNGGGISNFYTLTVTNSTFSGNSANYGGGIVNNGTLTVTNNTFSGNSASFAGGGIANDVNGILTVTNSTLSGNSAGWYGGGISNNRTLNYANTIIANSISGGDCYNFSTIGTNTNNLVEDGSCSASLSGDPNLGVLADNGGPTQTMALLAGSPAINAGDDATCDAAPVNNIDQRGVARPQGLHCDIGAYEYEGPFNQAPTDIALSNSSVAENQPAGTLVGNFSTTDPDAGDTFIYTLVAGSGSTDNASFQISGSQLQTNAVFNFEAKSSYSVRIRTTDSGGLSFERQFTITITDVNEDPTGLGLSPASIAENSPIGTVVGTFTTTDPDTGDTFTYSLVSGTGDTDNASFTIVDDELQTAADFDFETKSSYSIRVRTTDSGGLWYEEAFTITVTDVNETPTDIAIDNSSVTENQPVGTLVGNFSTTDPDAGDTHTYSLFSGAGDTDNASFQINGSQLQTNAVFDFETKTTYSIRVRTTDSGGLSFERQFTITITDVNEDPTGLGLSPASIAENSPIGTVVGTFTTTDPDTGDTFTYSLVSGMGDTDNASFTIVDDELQTAAVFDFETKTTYSIRVRTTDGGGLWYEEIFTITVTDVNETPTALTVNLLNDPGDGTCNVTECTLREAIALIAPGGTIDFDSSLSGGTIHLASMLTLSNNVTIDGSELASQITISGDTDNNGTGDVRVFYVNAGVTATLNSLTITKGYTSGNGGGIFNGGTLTLDASTVYANTAIYGGGIYNDWDATTTVTASKLLANTATNDGDAVFNEKNSTNAVSVTGSCIVNNGNVAFFNNQSASQTATGNWWGNATGSGPVGTGVGDTVSTNVDTSGYLTAPILGCPSVTRSALATSKAFAKPTIPLNTTTKLTITLNNPNTIPINWINFTDALPAGLTASAATALQCGGAVNISTPAQIVFSGGSLAANDGSPDGPDTCAINVTVRGIAPGIQTNASFTVERTGLPDGYSNATSITVYKTLQFRSSGSVDGWVLESDEFSNKGGSFNATSTTFHLGDDASNKQYRSILSFYTSGLPDDAVILSAVLKIKKQGLVGSNPFSTHQGLLVDIKKPYFGTGLALATHDFQAVANKLAVGTFGTTPNVGWYSVTLLNAVYPYINLTGTTQFRLRFKLDDDNDNTADYMKFFSGNYGTVTNRPVLGIQYYVP